MAILAIKDAESEQPDVIPLSDHRLSAGQLLLVIGEADDVNRFRELE